MYNLLNKVLHNNGTFKVLGLPPTYLGVGEEIPKYVNK